MARRRRPEVTCTPVLQHTNCAAEITSPLCPMEMCNLSHPKSQQCGAYRGWRSAGRNHTPGEISFKSVRPLCSPNCSSAELLSKLLPCWCLLPSVCKRVCMRVCLRACVCVIASPSRPAAKLSWSPGSCYFSRAWEARALPQTPDNSESF